MMTETFSKRYGYHLEDAGITIREDAPEELRYAIPQIASKLDMSYSSMRKIICQELLVPPDSFNWTEDPNIRNEVNGLIGSCLWFRVYDIAEALHNEIEGAHRQKLFSDRLNEFFREKGIGWEMREGQITYRGSEVFNKTATQAVTVLTESNRPRAANEIREALGDISRRPNPDVTGAIHHAMAAVEATARDVTGQPNPTLGHLVPVLDLPKSLDDAVKNLWRYASDRARHVREGDAVDTTEAELVVSVAGAVCTFLAKRKDKPSKSGRARTA